MSAEPALVSGAYALFDAAWETATDLAAFFDAARPRIDTRAREVLHALGSGLTDVTASHELGMSLRTDRRRVAELLVALGADSRFQAGVRGRVRPDPRVSRPTPRPKGIAPGDSLARGQAANSRSFGSRLKQQLSHAPDIGPASGIRAQTVASLVARLKGRGQLERREHPRHRYLRELPAATRSLPAPTLLDHVSKTVRNA